MFKRVIYLNHSGFIVEGENQILVFDFYTDPAQVLSQFENCGKPVSFFVSHNHPDHWNPDIFTFRNKVPNHYFLDMSLRAEARQLQANPLCKAVIHLVDEDTFLTREELTGSALDALVCAPSTDEGVAFLVQIENQSVYHAGDLNDWDWSDAAGPAVEQRYRSILEDLRKRSQAAAFPKPELAFVPVDQRLGEKALHGAIIFSEYFPVKHLAPMHLNGGLDLPRKLQIAAASGEYPALQSSEILDLSIEGQTFSLT